MRRSATAGVLTALAAASFGGTASAQDEGLLGRWRTSAENGVVAFERCGDSLCGRLMDAAPLRADPDQRDVRNRNPELRSRKLKGLVVMRGLSGGPTVWRGGPVYDPESGQSASSVTLTLDAQGRLAVRGCIAPLLCRTQTWTRAR